MFCGLSFSAETPRTTPACFPAVRAIAEGRRAYLENLVSNLEGSNPSAASRSIQMSGDVFVNWCMAMRLQKGWYQEILRAIDSQKEHVIELLLCTILNLQEKLKLRGSLPTETVKNLGEEDYIRTN